MGKTLERGRGPRRRDLQCAFLAFLTYTLRSDNILQGVISILTFGGHGLSELHPRHACYSRGAVLVACSILFSFNGLSLVDTVNFAWHFLHFGMDGDRDAYWLGVWGVCISCVACATS
jgi:hypothetical protein